MSETYPKPLPRFVISDGRQFTTMAEASQEQLRLNLQSFTIPVKIADLKDSMNTLRLSTLTNRDAQRLIKYHKALRYLESISL